MEPASCTESTLKLPLLRTLLFFLLVHLLATPAFAKEPVRTIDAFVTKVSDGDTLNVTDDLGTKVKVRLYGIDAPETEKASKKTGRVSKPAQPYGSEAREALTQKVYRQKVKLDVMDVDRYKRLVCLVWLGTRSINKEMVAEGWAWAYKAYLQAPYASEFVGIEERARAMTSGLWRQDNPEPPWEFRRRIRVR